MARGRGRSGGFSQSSVSKWAAGERRRQAGRDRQSDRAERKRRSGWVAEGIATGAVMATGMFAQPPVDAVYQADDAYGQARSGMDNNRDAYLEEQTRASGDSHGGSSQSADDIFNDLIGDLPDIGK